MPRIFRTYFGAIFHIFSGKERLISSHSAHINDGFCPNPSDKSSSIIVFTHDHDAKMILHAAVIRPDHVHMLLSPLSDGQGHPYSLSEIMKGIKGASATSVNKALVRKGKVWQVESFDHILRNEESLRDKGEYLANNPVRKGLTSRAEDYPWLWRMQVRQPAR
jgi:REP element-mobilizing transposase RayT